MFPNERKTKSIRRLGQVDIARLKERVLALSEEQWEAENRAKPNRFDALDATRHIVLRFLPNFLDWKGAADRPAMDEWRDVMDPVLAAATAPYGYRRGDFPRIMLARMAPGGVIQPHRDANPAAKWPHKVHVPLLTNPDVTFFIDGVGHKIAEGEAVEVNNMAVHAVENRGSTDRVHLIFEYYDRDQPDPAWLEPLKAQATAR